VARHPKSVPRLLPSEHAPDHPPVSPGDKIAGYNTWRNEFDRHVQEGEDAIWIWAPIITKQCPECENSQSYHEQSDCEYDETPPDEWSNGLVGFKPTSVFDVSQTEGEPLPELETEATGMPKTWFPCSSARRTISMSSSHRRRCRLGARQREEVSANIGVSVIFTQSSRRKPARIRPISP